ncbi:hypothetical protein ACMTAS_0256 [Thermotoga neapolitana DSM 4359]|jgi:putative endonuclease|uniref:UPF0102 protein CTN_0433 n=2 Tax=Thermotogaceae TaxID=188709 RepID=Y433_THENN|nr:RecName: Full=UPF0102 protein CTN_0433 [Thermotoga neapolitana DSM 4359]ACM22609.1 Hypothetical Protein CTN_0433 [Thermotoga neapolitana DSM 4359]KFZ22248.1 hypothetical protein LA10_02112 [Thermotoga neapolitana LA10]MDK2949825.1 putative endonuclease [Thermotoga sp.]
MDWRAAEDLACDFLKKKGYRILERNYRTKYGEIDIIARCGKETVFVEVKSGRGKVDPLERIDMKKVRNIEKAAKLYMLQKGLKGPVRVDFVRVTPKGIDHFEGLWLG